MLDKMVSLQYRVLKLHRRTRRRGLPRGELLWLKQVRSGDGHEGSPMGTPAKRPRQESSFFETSIIHNLKAASRRKELAQDATALIRVLEMALVLNGQEYCSAQDLEKLRARNTIQPSCVFSPLESN
ncbi:hypothetical protein TSUD_219540 [Trifolium subterraneum]|uniref:Uncharacterized protein n=1 Tax=Trifolium subterraneum TaxID=3900 RepID=A0A2Z6N5S3_TRISU|nr:hypothetical protein TSUD_219540 [Trifolium subterraneum]